MSVFYDGYRERNPVKWVKRFLRHWKWAYQRAVRGYADCDAWDVRSWFLGVMPGILETFAKDLHSFPAVTNPEDPHWAESKPVMLAEDVTDDPADQASQLYRTWQDTLRGMAAKFRDADESTCSVLNPVEAEWIAMYDAFDSQYGFLGSKLDEGSTKKGFHTVHFPSEVCEEWKEISDRYLAEEQKLAEYRIRCFEEGIDSFKSWFWDLWD